MNNQETNDFIDQLLANSSIPAQEPIPLELDQLLDWPVVPSNSINALPGPGSLGNPYNPTLLSSLPSDSDPFLGEHTNAPGLPSPSFPGLTAPDYTNSSLPDCSLTGSFWQCPADASAPTISVESAPGTDPGSSSLETLTASQPSRAMTSILSDPAVDSNFPLESTLDPDAGSMVALDLGSVTRLRDRRARKCRNSRQHRTQLSKDRSLYAFLPALFYSAR